MDLPDYSWHPRPETAMMLDFETTADQIQRERRELRDGEYRRDAALRLARKWDGKMLHLRVIDDIAGDPERVQALVDEAREWLPDCALGVRVWDCRGNVLHDARPYVTGHRMLLVHESNRIAQAEAEAVAGVSDGS